jgi:hypothetical protein
MDVVLAMATKADLEMNTEIAATKRQFAASLLDDYQNVVAACDSPRFTREAERLKQLISTIDSGDPHVIIAAASPS